MTTLLVLTRADGPLHNARGFFVIGPQCVNPSDVLARLIADARGRLTETHYAPNPVNQRRQHVTYTGRTARRRRYPSHGPEQFAQELVA